MLDFPFQLEKRAFVANRKARNQGWWNTGFPALTLFLISGCGNLFWIQLQVENPSLAEQPERPSCQSPKCAAETLALFSTLLFHREKDDKSPPTGTPPTAGRVKSACDSQDLSPSAFLPGLPEGPVQPAMSSVALGHSVASLSLSVSICKLG